MEGKENKEEDMEFPVRGSILECPKCKRKILVERALFGIDHTLSLSVTCWDCLNKDQQEWANKRYGLDEKHS
ncbi:MAG: hypothetical protein AB1422_06340 [bacterium]